MHRITGLHCQKGIRKIFIKRWDGNMSGLMIGSTAIYEPEFDISLIAIRIFAIGAAACGLIMIAMKLIV